MFIQASMMSGVVCCGCVIFLKIFYCTRVGLVRGMPDDDDVST